MKQVYIEFAMRVMHWREKAGVFCGFTLLPSVSLSGMRSLGFSDRDPSELNDEEPGDMPNSYRDINMDIT